MLRRRLSAGALRAAAQAQAQQTATPIATASLHSQAASASRNGGVTPSAAAAKATINTPQQSKSLASAVLLGTQRKWKTETVVTLKAELKRRGLSQTGNKSTLVARLESAEQSKLAPPMPPVSQAARMAAKALAQRSRSFAASAAASASEPKAPTPLSTEQVVSNAPDVNAPKSTAPKAAELTPEQKTTAPGLPVDHPTKASEFTYKFPEPQEIPEREQTIPSLPHKFGASKPSEPTKSSSEPKVVTVASAATHPSGGPVHGDQAVVDADALERQVIEAEVQADELFKLSGLPEIPFKLPEIPLPEVTLPTETSGEYKASSRPLNSEERTGAWVIAGIVGAVALFGWGSGNAKVAKGVDAVKEEAEGLKDKAEGKASELKGKADKAKQDLEGKASSLKDKVEKKYEEAKDAVKEKAGEYEDKVTGEVKRVVGKIEGKAK